MGFSSRFKSGLFDQNVIDLVPDFEPDPEAVVAVDGLPRGEVDGQGTPLDAVVGSVEDGIKDGSEVYFTRLADGFCWGQKGVNVVPFGVGEVTWIGHTQDC